MPTMSTKYRILSLDGGPGTPTYTRYLRAIEYEAPGFLAKVNMIAGTSDGSMATLFLASRPSITPDNGKDVAESLVAFSDQTFRTFQPGPFGALRMASGFFPMENNRRLEAHLKEAFGPSKRLGDLNRQVCVVTYRLCGPYGPKIYHNFGNDPDRDSYCYDVALQSGATPIALPIRQGCADGAVFANNPSMCALTTAVANKVHLPDVDGLDDIVIFSLGGDERRFASKEDDRDFSTHTNVGWGWLHWLASMRNPLLLMELLLNSDGKGTAFQCEQLIGDHYLRLAVTPEGAPVLDFLGIVFNQTHRVVDKAKTTASRWDAERNTDRWSPNFEETLGWVKRVWMEE